MAALLWGLSGLSHPIMVWLSPRPASFSTPVWPLELGGAQAPGAIMEGAGISSAVEVRAVRTGPEAAKTANDYYLIREGADGPRRYFNPQTGAEQPDGDRMRAEALARYYSGDQSSPIKSADYLTQHTADYPANNPLLPVWRVVFDRSDRITVYVDTGSGRLATIGNRKRDAILTVFTNVHTMSFLPAGAEWARVMLIGLLIGSLFAAAVLGLGLLILLRARRKATMDRKWHRILAHAAVIPALMFSSSGLYHLLHASTLLSAAPSVVPQTRFSASELLGLKGDDMAAMAQTHAATQAVTGLSAARSEAGDLVWRVALAAPQQSAGHSALAHAHHGAMPDQVMSAAKALPTALWIKGDSGALMENAAQDIARALATKATGLGENRIVSMDQVHGFTPEYGFLNKRLPVWRVAFDDPETPLLFVDAADAVVAATVSKADVREGKFFNTIHKWSFLDWMGQKPRDVVIMSFVALIVLTSLFGWVTQIRRIRQSGTQRKKSP
ncbi:PepSY domain-containing protein [Iodidimonas gelatinilytica]|nr:PepSY domain-containing protein [Iodidimonas gelatinilytica]